MRTEKCWKTSPSSCLFLYQLGMKLIVVHGGGSHASSIGEKLGVESEFVNGRRVTSSSMLEVAKMSFGGKLNTDIVACCNKHDIRAVGISGIDGNLISATKRPAKDSVDYGYVGDVVSIDTDVLAHMLDGGYVPVVASLAADKDGQVLNINADTVASTIASSVSAEKYIVLSNVDGVMIDVNDSNTLCSVLSVSETEDMIQSGQIAGGMLPKIAACVAALNAGVTQVHIVNGMLEDTLLKETFTNEGCGTMIVSGENKPASAISVNQNA